MKCYWIVGKTRWHRMRNGKIRGELGKFHILVEGRLKITVKIVWTFDTDGKKRESQ